MYNCKICASADGNKPHIVREMMNGTRDKFEYIECGACGCLWLGKIPENIAEYYPDGYYSFKESDGSKDGFIESLLNRQKTLRRLNGRDITKKTPQYIDWFKRAHVTLNSKILDVGCGSGSLLISLQKDGFTDILGIDPYIKDDIIYSCGVKVLKKDAGALDGQFDLIMLNHSLEHMQDHFGIFKELRRLLKDTGILLVRTPLVSSDAWKEFGVDWVQVDAPRHLLLHSVNSMRILAERTGFGITDIVFDSTEFQFWGSIQYQKDIPLKDARSYAVSPQSSIFSESEIENFKERAKRLNKEGSGDQACFYINKI